jgi:hypothetical protein
VNSPLGNGLLGKSEKDLLVDLRIGHDLGENTAGFPAVRVGAVANAAYHC